MVTQRAKPRYNKVVGAEISALAPTTYRVTSLLDDAFLAVFALRPTVPHEQQTRTNVSEHNDPDAQRDPDCDGFGIINGVPRSPNNHRGKDNR